MSANPMLQGSVKFCARILGKGVTFPLFEFEPKESGVDKVEMHGPDGNEILSTVYLGAVASSADGINIAQRINTVALNRISFFHRIIIEGARITDSQFSALDVPPGFNLAIGTSHASITEDEAGLVVGLSADRLRTELELESPAGEHNFGLFRSALQATSPVEKYMHLYNILLMLFNDEKRKVDKFILGENPEVPRTPEPRLRRSKILETVYTRLRNELAHKRDGVNLEDTKAEMTNRLPELIALTKRAIELRS
jgi:hypothetical protein